MDQQPIIREKTVIAVIHLAPKLSFANLDEVVVMKHFSRLLRDEQPGIRTNTTVCLGKIARHLHYQTRQKVLASAFGGKLKDPFPPARIAAINALAATQQYYTLQETSSRVVPMLCSLMTDPEKPVRDQVFKVARGFIQKLEQVSEDPDLKEEMEAMVNKNQESSSSSATVSSWASWAVGAIGAKFYKSSIKAPSPGTGAETSGTNSTPKSKEDQMMAKPLKPTPVGAMKLGGGSGSDQSSGMTSMTTGSKSDDLMLMDDDEENNGWNNDDLDVNEAWESLDQGKVYKHLVKSINFGCQ